MDDLKAKAIQKAKQAAASATNVTNGSNGTKKRRKGTDLKPIITMGEEKQDGSPTVATNS